MKHFWQAIGLVLALALCSLPASADTSYYELVTVTADDDTYSALTVQNNAVGSTCTAISGIADGVGVYGLAGDSAGYGGMFENSTTPNGRAIRCLGAIDIMELGSAPSNPSATTGTLYALDDQTLHYRDSMGVDTDLIAGDGGGGGGAPTGATYITQTHDGTLSAEQAMGDLATGLVKNTTTTGVQSIATAGTDFVAPTTTSKRSIMLRPYEMWPSSTTGASGPTKRELATNKVNIQELDFVGIAVTKLYAQFTTPMPDNWDGGTIFAKFYWSTGAIDSGPVVWGIQGRSYGDAESIDQAWGTAQEVTDNCTGTANQFLISAETSACTLSGTPAGGELVQFRVYRDATNAADTETATVSLDSVKIEYTINAYSE